MVKDSPEAALHAHPLASSLTETDRAFLVSVMQRYHLSYQQTRMLIEQAIDLSLWRQPPIATFWDESAGGNRTGKPKLKAIIGKTMDRIAALRTNPTDYADFFDSPRLASKVTHVETLDDVRLLGRCPCPVSGEKTRCCNLLTLDVVQQCAFACSYCSIQSFYHKNEIVFVENLRERLEHLELPEDAWHIGTGQSSDSLMWGNEHGLLDALAHFSRKHPEIVVELKTKSARVNWISTVDFPRSVVATWSLNVPTIIEKEEHGSASLERRLDAARAAADAGMLVGFHLHPMVYFKGWEQEYQSVVRAIVDRFSRDEVLMISLGTLTFTKEVLRQLREGGQPSRILQMELQETAGKYSYPREVKQQMFSHAYHCFPDSWKGEEGPFFYLCMEVPELWEPVLGISYANNAAFESAMREHYTRRIQTQSLQI